jgi:choline-sulfatase
MRRLYYDEVTYTDAEIGRLLSTLGELGLYDDLVVVLVADHGELLGEHGRRLTGHATMLVDATLKVPLLVRAPNAAGPRRSDQQVRVLDVFPTILDATGLAVPPGIEGLSLLEVEPSKLRPAYSETFYENWPERAKDGDELTSMRLSGWKLLVGPDREELYDLETDPAEIRDVSGDHPGQIDRLRQELRELSLRWPEDLRPQELELSEEETEGHLERLRSLGYVE